MYRKLQGQAKEYLVNSLCQICDEWRFDIDTSNKNNPIVVGYGPNDIVIRTAIEVIHTCMPIEVLKKMTALYDSGMISIGSNIGCLIIRHCLRDIFGIYGIEMIRVNNSSVTFKILSRDETRGFYSFVFCNGECPA